MSELEETRGHGFMVGAKCFGGDREGPSSAGVVNAGKHIESGSLTAADVC